MPLRLVLLGLGLNNLNEIDNKPEGLRKGVLFVVMSDCLIRQGLT